MDEFIGKKYLIKETAKRAFFTRSDVNLIYNTFVEVLSDLIKEKHETLKNSSDEDIDVIGLTGLFSARIKKIAAHEGHDAVRNQKAFFDESYKVVFKPSRKFIALIRGEDEDEEE